MITEPVTLALIGSTTSVIVALIVMFQVRGVKSQITKVEVSLNHELQALKAQIAASSFAEGRAEGMQVGRAIAKQDMLDRATAAALVEHPEGQAPAAPQEVVVVNDEPVPVRVEESKPRE